MKRFFPLLVAAFAVAIGLLATAGIEPRPVSAAVTTFEVKLSGGLENPPVTNDTVGGFARFRFDDVAQTLQYDLTVSGASADLVTAAHIHRGAKGVNGPIVYTLSDKGFTQISGSIKLTDSDVIDLLVGDLYVNVHSKQNPGGAARGQLDLPITASDIATAYRRFVAVGNRGNIEAVLSYYAANASFEGGTVCAPRACVGQAEIRRHFDGIIASHTDIRNVRLTPRGNDLEFRTDVINDATKAMGLERIIVTGNVTFAAGKITRHSVGFDASDPQTARFLAALAASGGGPGIRPPATGDAGLASD